MGKSRNCFLNSGFRIVLKSFMTSSPHPDAIDVSGVGGGGVCVEGEGERDGYDKQ